MWTRGHDRCPNDPTLQKQAAQDTALRELHLLRMTAAFILALGASTLLALALAVSLAAAQPAPPVVPDSVRILVSVPGRRLYLVQGDRLVRDYPVAVGRPATPTPQGSYRILQKTKDPTWAPRGRAPVPPGPANPLGRRWMRISEDGYGIHATNDAGSIGGARSHGCIRMLPEDAEDLFERVSVGTPVVVLAGPAGS
jgi:lipoprotein-anchoring transpeptidase ErfK/SrfK